MWSESPIDQFQMPTTSPDREIPVVSHAGAIVSVVMKPGCIGTRCLFVAAATR